MKSWSKMYKDQNNLYKVIKLTKLTAMSDKWL